MHDDHRKTVEFAGLNKLKRLNHRYMHLRWIGSVR